MPRLHHPPAVRRAYRTSTLIWFLFLLPATLAAFGPAVAFTVAAAGLLWLIPQLRAEPGRWWESTRAGVDLPTLALSVGLGVAAFVPAQWGWLGAGAPRLLWIFGTLLGLLVLMVRASRVIQGAFWGDTRAAARRRWFHRLCVGLSAGVTALVGAAYVALAAPQLWAPELLGAFLPIAAGLALVPPLAFPLVGLIALDADATLAIKRWSLQAGGDTDEQDAFGRRGVWPARRLAGALQQLQSDHGLTPSLSPDGWMFAGAIDGLPLRLSVEQARLPPRITIEVDVPGLPPGLWVQHRDRAPQGVLSDPVLSTLVSAGGAPPAIVEALLAGLHADVLSVIAGHQRAEIRSGRVRVTLLWEEGAGAGEGWLAESISDVVSLGRALKLRADRTARPAPQARRRTT